MVYKWEIYYLDLDNLQLVLRLTYGSRHLIPMIIFDTAHFHDWRLGDRIAVDTGEMTPMRELQKKMGLPMSEEDYTLFNERTGGKAIIRKIDCECEDAFAWLKEWEIPPPPSGYIIDAPPKK